MVKMDAETLTRMFAPIYAAVDGQPVALESDGETIAVKGMDEAHVCVITAVAKIPAKAMKIAFGPEAAMDALKDMSGKITADYDTSRRAVTLTGEWGRRTFKTMQASVSDVKLPEAGIREDMDIALLRHAVSFAKIDETLTIRADGERLYMEAENDLERAESWTETTITKAMKAQYPAEYLSKIIRSIRLDEGKEKITAYIDCDYPLRLEWEFAGAEYTYCIAPRIEDDS